MCALMKNKKVFLLIVIALFVLGLMQYYNAFYPPEPRISGWDQPVSSREEALTISAQVLPQLVPGATNNQPICVFETKTSYIVIYPMVVPVEHTGDDRKTEVILPKLSRGKAEVKLRGMTEQELQERLRITDHQ